MPVLAGAGAAHLTLHKQSSHGQHHASNVTGLRRLLPPPRRQLPPPPPRVHAAAHTLPPPPPTACPTPTPCQRRRRQPASAENPCITGRAVRRDRRPVGQAQSACAWALPACPPGSPIGGKRGAQQTFNTEQQLFCAVLQGDLARGPIPPCNAHAPAIGHGEDGANVEVLRGQQRGLALPHAPHLDLQGRGMERVQSCCICLLRCASSPSCLH